MMMMVMIEVQELCDVVSVERVFLFFFIVEWSCFQYRFGPPVDVYGCEL